MADMKDEKEYLKEILGTSKQCAFNFKLRSLPRDFSRSFYRLLKTFLFARPELGAILSSYLEGALYKCHRKIDRQKENK